MYSGLGVINVEITSHQKIHHFDESKIRCLRITTPMIAINVISVHDIHYVLYDIYLKCTLGMYLICRVPLCLF